MHPHPKVWEFRNPRWKKGLHKAPVPGRLFLLRAGPAERHVLQPEQEEVLRKMKKFVALFALGVCLQSAGSGASGRSLLRQAVEAERSGRLWEAAALLQKLCAVHPDRKDIRRKLYSINKTLYLTPAICPGTKFYLVVRGDTLSSIARRFAITAGLLRRLNALKSDNLRVGQKLKVVRGPFHVRVIKKTFTLQVLSREKKVLFTYPVGLGKEGSTPTGTFLVGPRLIKPTQFDRSTGKVYKYGEPGHTIGTRWITFSGSYGIHGTIEPESIGKQESKGCVRMLNHDVEELFDLLVSGKSTVTILSELPSKSPRAEKKARRPQRR